MIAPFCDLPNPNSCSFENWSMQVRDLLVQHGYQWDNLRVVACGTSPLTFSALFDDPRSGVVIERCTPGKIYYYNGVVWVSIPFLSGGSETFTVLRCHTNVPNYPLPYGGDYFVSYANTPVMNATYGTIAGNVWTCAAEGWYRFTASMSLRISGTGVYNTGGSPMAWHRLRLYRSATIFDHRHEFTEHGRGIMQWRVPIGPITFDVVLTEAAAPAGMEIFVMQPTVQGVTWMDVGQQMVVRCSSVFNSMAGGRNWGIGGSANPTRRETLLIERLNHV